MQLQNTLLRLYWQFHTSQGPLRCVTLCVVVNIICLTSNGLLYAISFHNEWHYGLSKSLKNKTVGQFLFSLPFFAWDKLLVCSTGFLVGSSVTTCAAPEAWLSRRPLPRGNVQKDCCACALRSWPLLAQLKNGQNNSNKYIHSQIINHGLFYLNN